MFDDLRFEDWVEGIGEVGFDLINSNSYPNPAVNELVISFENNKNSTFEIYIYDVLGKEIYRSNTKSDLVNISVSDYKSGSYFYKLVDKIKQKYTTGKFIKE